MRKHSRYVAEKRESPSILALQSPSFTVSRRLIVGVHAIGEEPTWFAFSAGTVQLDIERMLLGQVKIVIPLGVEGTTFNAITVPYVPWFELLSNMLLIPYPDYSLLTCQPNNVSLFVLLTWSWSFSFQVGGRAVAYYMLTTVLAVILGIILVTTIRPGGGTEADDVKKVTVENGELQTRACTRPTQCQKNSTS